MMYGRPKLMINGSFQVHSLAGTRLESRLRNQSCHSSTPLVVS
jgi:hypothetical protein